INDWYMLAVGEYPSEVILLVIQTTIASFFVMVFGEVIPKAMFRTYPDLLISILSTPLRFLSFVFSPLVYVATNASNVLIGMFYKDVASVEEFFKRSDIELLFRENGGDNSCDLDKDDSEILTNVLELQNVRVKDSIIPRTEIVAVEKDATIKEALQLF